MKELFLLTLFAILFGCDPSESVDIVISNNTSSDIEVSFVSHTILSDMPNNTETINIQSNAVTRYDRLSAGGSLDRAT